MAVKNTSVDNSYDKEKASDNNNSKDDKKDGKYSDEDRKEVLDRFCGSLMNRVPAN